MSITVALVSCGSSKAAVASMAQDLYLGHLFAAQRAYAERYAHAWHILSAKHGLVDPRTILEPYDLALADQSIEARKVWGASVVRDLKRIYPSATTFIMLAGSAYRKAITHAMANEAIRWRCWKIDEPLAHMPIGRQRQWLTQQVKASA